MNGAPDEQSTLAFVDVRRRVARNLRRNHRAIADIFSNSAVRYARLSHRLTYRMLESVEAIGFERLKHRNDVAPIMAWSHKKVHDVFVIVECLAGRPLERFHNITIVAQAGVFSAIYPYRDIFPDFLKKGPLKKPLMFAARKLGDLFRHIFRTVNAYPVYRDLKDIPGDQEEYESDAFGGAALHGQNYDEYVRFANRETRNSLMSVMRDMEERNRVFVILPEGGYRGDGSIGKLHDFMGFAAFRKEREALLCPISYDELCPDHKGRFAAYVNFAEILPPPESKAGLNDYLEQVKTSFTTNTIVTPSHIIGAILEHDRDQGNTLQREDLLRRYHQSIQALRKRSDAVLAPTLSSDRLARARLKRFFRAYWLHYLQYRKGAYEFREQNATAFNPAERSVNNLTWNANHILHLKNSLAL